MQEKEKKCLVPFAPFPNYVFKSLSQGHLISKGKAVRERDELINTQNSPGDKWTYALRYCSLEEISMDVVFQSYSTSSFNPFPNDKFWALPN